MVSGFAGNEATVLGPVTVRLFDQQERSEFDNQLQQPHYLRSSLLVGQPLRPVAELDSRWVGLPRRLPPGLWF
jgi:hypothetical protein